jgi:hypothetical protein
VRILLTKAEVLDYSERYEYPGDTLLADSLHVAAQRGYMTRSDLIEVAKWKWKGGRTRQLAGQNSEEDVQEITRVSFATANERLRIGALLTLQGVHWPMASVILHFAFPDRYPILDVRAIETVEGSKFYSFENWLKYTELCRKTARDMNVTMRVLDRALWARDKALNPKRSKS